VTQPTPVEKSKQNSNLDGQHFEVVIIGAGMAGLASGIRLGLAGKKSIILERHNASGGLNSFYSINGIKYDVGLHALTNYVPKGTKGTPLTKLLRQLRIPYDAFDLAPQKQSKVHFPSAELFFNNDFSFLESQVADQFPNEIDGFRKLSHTIRDLDAFNLSNEFTSTRQSIQRFFQNPLLESMLLCPTMYYGSATENDMDFGQFAIMFRSLFFEGFARPLNGVRTIIKALQDQYRSLGGIRKMRCGVQKICTKNNSVSHLTLDDGSSITADKIISTAGISETFKLCEPTPAQSEKNIGNLGFTETITLFEGQPKDLGWDDTIIFFSEQDDFKYQSPTSELVDPASGVICMPNNYEYPNCETLEHGILRITALAHPKDWFNLEETNYQKQKNYWYSKLQEVALNILEPKQSLQKIPSEIVATDMFTPRTVHKYTGHINGAIYGAPQKIKDGRTHLDNLFIAGTDQGFLGIIGAMLSGISMTNLHCLKD
jgi:phytoene dehydrogenase-like protein